MAAWKREGLSRPGLSRTGRDTTEFFRHQGGSRPGVLWATVKPGRTKT